MSLIKHLEQTDDKCRALKGVPANPIASNSVLAFVIETRKKGSVSPMFDALISDSSK